MALTTHKQEIPFPMETSRIHVEQQKELNTDKAFRLECRKNIKYKKLGYITWISTLFPRPVATMQQDVGTTSQAGTYQRYI